eukprot:scaffold153149_cov32-Tisochrysis_lutea.AAC.2
MRTLHLSPVSTQAWLLSHLRDLLEDVRVASLVRVVTERQLPIALLQLLVTCLGRHAEPEVELVLHGRRRAREGLSPSPPSLARSKLNTSDGVTVELALESRV